MKIFVSLLLFLSSCNLGPEPTIETQYKKYVDLFEQESRNVGHPTTVGRLSITSVFTLGGYRLAQCRMYNFPYPSIQVSLYWWEKLNETEKEMCLLHEIGHCRLKRMHLDDLYSDGRHKSIMNAEMFEAKVYLDHREEYIRELFENSP